jgi:hypothetical protein
MKITIVKQLLCLFGLHDWQGHGEWTGFPMTQEASICKRCGKVFICKPKTYETGSPLG